MELRQLEYFLMVSQVNSFTRAAERLYVSQPAVTNAIRGLEEELGILLFDRGQKQALLTTEGKVFYNHVEKVMYGVSQTISEINDLKNLNNGIMTLGLTPLGGMAPVPQCLKEFRAAYPNITLDFLEASGAEIVNFLMEDKVDLAFIIAGEKTSALEFFVISKQELVVCCAKNHHFSRKNSLALEELIHESLILFTSRYRLRQIIVEKFEEVNALPQIAFTSNHVQTIKNLVACNAGLSILPRGLCESDNHLTDVVS